MRKLRLATVFSGIGAVEHALDRMGVPYEIVFASDNGDVDIFSSHVGFSLDEIEKKLCELKIRVCKQEDSIDKAEFDVSLCNIENKLNALKTFKDGREHKLLEVTANCYAIILNSFFIAPQVRRKLENLDAKKESSIYDLFEFSLAVSKVMKTLRSNHDCECLENLLDEMDVKKHCKAVRDVAERLSMLDGSINSYEEKRRIFNISDYDERKAYVDKLYEPYDKNNKVKKSYFANYNINPRHFHWNVCFIDGREYHDKVDLFVGGSPCQSFSAVGKQRGLEDARGTLFYEYARLIKEVNPKIFIYENVKAVLSNDNGKTWQTMSNIFTSLNYDWDYKVLNAKDYGVPQNRERVFVVGIRKDIAKGRSYIFPEPVELKSVMRDYLLDNVDDSFFLPEKGIKFVADKKNINKAFTQIDGKIALCQKKNQQFNWHGDFVSDVQNFNKYYLSEKVEKYVMSPGTKTFHSKPAIDLEIARPLLNTMHKMHRAGVDNYVTTHGRIRKLTPRECLRLMGFSDSFKIVVPDISMYQQAGNSIVVDILIKLIENIFMCFPGELET